MFSFLDFRGHIVCLRELINILRQNSSLLFTFIKKDITDSFSGQILGASWAIGHPLFLLCFYVVIFNVIFPYKFGSALNLPLDYTSFLLSGLVPWLSIQLGITKSCSCISSNSTLVKQLIFPLEILPLCAVLAPFVSLFVGVLFLIIYNLFAHHAVYITYFLIPYVVLMQILLTGGLAYGLASISVYVRDTKDLVQLYVTIGMFIIPVFILPASTPLFLKVLFYINPFSYIIWAYQDVLYYGNITHYGPWIVMTVLYPLIFIWGYRMFRKLKTYFGHAI